MASIRLLIVDDHAVYRRTLRRMCEAKFGFTVVGEAANGQEAVELARTLSPDVILMDVEMPVMDGVDATRRIVEANPQARVIILTVHQREDYFTGATHAGARGYLLKDIHWHELAEAVKLVYNGGRLFDRALASANGSFPRAA